MHAPPPGGPGLAARMIDILLLTPPMCSSSETAAAGKGEKARVGCCEEGEEDESEYFLGEGGAPYACYFGHEVCGRKNREIIARRRR